MPDRLSWTRNDIEQKFGFTGGRFTSVNGGLCITLAVMMSVLFYFVMFLLGDNWFGIMFTHRGTTPFLMVPLAWWAFFILVFKSSKIRLQRTALKIRILPNEHNFVLSPNTVDSVLQNVFDAVEQPKHWFLFNRIAGTLSNLKNIGNVSDVSNVLQSYNTQDAETVETSYSLLNGSLWAIPVLGFIGTAEGLSQAIGTFSKVLAAGTDISELTSSLQVVTGGLSTAFETTLIALVLALFLQLYTTAVKKREEELLLDCSEYCQQNIIAHLRMSNIVKDD
jgi:biopolymer transport protein ExbB/TolQ